MSAKSSTRKSPTAHAAGLKLGTVKVGNDGKKWIVVERKNGSHYWVPYIKEVETKTKDALTKKPEYIAYEPQGTKFKI